MHPAIRLVLLLPSDVVILRRCAATELTVPKQDGTVQRDDPADLQLLPVCLH
jgi:hypothetical protein